MPCFVAEAGHSGKTYRHIGTTDYKMRFDYLRLFMGTRYAAFYYPTEKTGGYVTFSLSPDNNR